MSIFRYSEWDGTQELFDLDKDELMDAVGDNDYTTFLADERIEPQVPGAPRDEQTNITVDNIVGRNGFIDGRGKVGHIL